MRVLIRAHSAKLDALHGTLHRASVWRWNPLRLRRWWWLRESLLLLLLLKRWKHIVARCRGSGLSLCELAGHSSVDMSVGWIGTTESVPDGAQLSSQELVLLLSASTILGVRP
jgi:hypothetical protein